MSVRAWRIVKKKHAATAFSGDGAKLFGGRWNSAGVAVVYAAGSLSLGMLELMVHLHKRALLEKYVVFEVSFDEAMVEEAGRLPRGWRESPPGREVQEVGDRWVRGGRSAVLRVPSVIAPGEWNYVMNPAHGDFGRVKIGAARRLVWDKRLLRGT